MNTRGMPIRVSNNASHSRRQIALSPSLTLLLREHKVEEQAQRILLGKPLVDSGLVFSHPTGEPLDPGVINHTFSKVLKKARLPHIRFHDLRHTHATLMLKQGIHSKIVSERLGHASIAVTLDTYSHIPPGLQEAAAQCFDELLEPELAQIEHAGKMLAKDSELDSEPHRNRTCNLLIKSQLLFQLS